MEQKEAAKKAPFKEMSFEDFTGGSNSKPVTEKAPLPDAPEIPQDTPPGMSDLFEGLDFDDEGDEDGFDFDRLSEPDFEPRTQRENPEKWKRAGRLFGAFVDFVFPTGFSMYSGANRSNYKMDKEGRQDLEEAAADFFEVIDWEPSPHAQFFTVLAGTVGPMAYQAHQDKKRIEKAAEYQERRARAEEVAATQGPESEAAFEAIVEAKKAKPKRDRNQFQVDINGFYETAPLSKGGDYIQQEDRTEKASAEILDIINDGKARGYSKGRINKECRIHLYGDAKVAR